MRPPWSMPLRQSCNICTATYNRYQSNQCSKQLMSWTISHKTYPNMNKYVSQRIIFQSPALDVSTRVSLKMARPLPGLCNFLRWKLVALNVPPWSFESGPCLARMTHGTIEWSNLNLTVSRHVTYLTMTWGSSPAVQTCPHHLVLDQSLVLVRHTFRQHSHRTSFVPYANNGLPSIFVCLCF